MYLDGPWSNYRLQICQPTLGLETGATLRYLEVQSSYMLGWALELLSQRLQMQCFDGAVAEKTYTGAVSELNSQIVAYRALAELVLRPCEVLL